MTVNDLILPSDLSAYVAAKPDKEERAKDGVDGSATELRIVSTLVRAGATAEEVMAYFVEQQLPCFAEPGRGESWLCSLIERAHHEEESFALTSMETEDTHTTCSRETTHSRSETDV